MANATKQQLLEQGMSMLLRHGYHDLGIAAVLDATGIPKGSSRVTPAGRTAIPNRGASSWL